MSIVPSKRLEERLGIAPTIFNIPLRDLETLLDAYAYLLSTDSRTSGISWILGDVGMGAPANTPFGYISPQTENVIWYSANGGTGGLAAGMGLDDWMIPIILTVCIAPHQFVAPVQAVPPPSSPFSLQTLGSAPPYMEQPGWRTSLEITQNIEKVMRTNTTVGGAATDTRIVESRYVLVDIQNTLFRARRVVIQTQQRRRRGD